MLNAKEATIIGAGIGLAVGLVSIGIYAFNKLTGASVPDVVDDVVAAASETVQDAVKAAVDAVDVAAE